MVSCIRAQQLTVNSISGKPQINNGKFVSKTHCNHSRNPDQDLTDAQRHVKKQTNQKETPIVFDICLAKKTSKLNQCQHKTTEDKKLKYKTNKKFNSKTQNT